MLRFSLAGGGQVLVFVLVSENSRVLKHAHTGQSQNLLKRPRGICLKLLDLFTLEHAWLHSHTVSSTNNGSLLKTKYGSSNKLRSY